MNVSQHWSMYAHTGRPLFPGTSTMNQLERILSLIGPPSAEDVEAIESPFAATMLEGLHKSFSRHTHNHATGASSSGLSSSDGKSRLENSSLFASCPKDAVDLLRKCLVFNPKKRITAEEALKHPYVNQFHNPSDEPTCDRVVSIPINDNTKYSIAEYRDKLYSEILRRKKELKKIAKDKAKRQQQRIVPAG